MTDTTDLIARHLRNRNGKWQNAVSGSIVYTTDDALLDEEAADALAALAQENEVIKAKTIERCAQEAAAWELGYGHPIAATEVGQKIAAAIRQLGKTSEPSLD